MVLLKLCIANDTTDFNNFYLIYKDLWLTDKWNNTANVGFDHQYNYRKGTGLINMNLRTSSLGSDYDYTQLSLTVINKTRIGKFDFNTRTFVQYGTGTQCSFRIATLCGRCQS
jgi:hypothetical protein